MHHLNSEKCPNNFYRRFKFGFICATWNPKPVQILSLCSEEKLLSNNQTHAKSLHFCAPVVISFFHWKCFDESKVIYVYFFMCIRLKETFVVSNMIDSVSKQYESIMYRGLFELILICGGLFYIVEQIRNNPQGRFQFLSH